MGSSSGEVDRLLQAARLHLAKGEFHEATEQASEAIRRDNKQPAAYLVRAEAHRKLKRPDKALADLAVAIRLDPNQPGPYVVRAEILKRRNLFDQAIADASHAIIMDARNAAAYSIRAECRSAIGDQEGAIEDVQEMVQIDPTRPVPDLRAKSVLGDPNPAVDLEDERFWKQSGRKPSNDTTVFADGKPVDKTYRSRRLVSDDDAPEALGVASGYKPGTIGTPIPRLRGKGRNSTGNGGGIVLIIGVSIVAACALWMVIRGASGPVASPRLAEPQPTQVARADTQEETAVVSVPVSDSVHKRGDDRPALNPVQAATAVALPVASQPGSENDTLSSLRGTWLAFTEVADGKRISDEEMRKKQKTLRVVDDTFTLFTTYYRVVGKIRPVPRDGDNAIDLDGKYVVGSNGENLLLRGLFEIKNNTLRLCYSVNNDRQVNERPTKSELDEERGGMCVSFRRTDRRNDAEEVRSPRDASTRPPDDAVAFNGHAYKFFPEVLPWHRAKSRCEEIGGHLATVSNRDENDFVMNLALQGIGRLGPMDGVWLGATDEHKEGAWEWVDGSKLSFTLWGPAQPNNKQGREHYLLLFLPKNEWSDQPNESTQHVAYFVCEWDGGSRGRASAPPSAGNSGVHSSPAEQSSHPDNRTMQLVQITELQPPEPVTYPSLTNDGLTLFYECKDSEIWTAKRKDADSLFQGKERLFAGRHPPVTSDGLQLVFLASRTDGRQGVSIHMANRDSLNDTFKRPKEVQELRDQKDPKSPWIAADGLTLLFSHESSDGKGSEILTCSRSRLTSAWSAPKPLSLNPRVIDGASPAWASLSEDGLTLYCSIQGGGRMNDGKPNLSIWSRDTKDSPFTNPSFIEIPGLPPLVGRCPRYVPATNELYFSWGKISVVRNFKPAAGSHSKLGGSGR